GAARERRSALNGGPRPVWYEVLSAFVDGEISLARDDARAALAIARNARAKADATQARDSDALWENQILFLLNGLESRAELMLGDYAASEKRARAAREARATLHNGVNQDDLDLDELSSQIALALIGQKRTKEALAVIEPVVKRRRDVQAR